MLIIVGSRNPVKIKAARNVFRKLLGNKIEVYGVEVAVPLSNQPIGMEETVNGAVERARFAINSNGKADFGVGIEAGLVEVPRTMSGFMNQQFTAIIDREGAVTIGGSSAFEFPKIIVNEVLSSKIEVEQVMERVTGIGRIGEKRGAIGFLSHGKLNRVKLIEQSVFMAMIPRINKQLYSLK
jgi:inosine/xanthosine triphosphatase